MISQVSSDSKSSAIKWKLAASVAIALTVLFLFAPGSIRVQAVDDPMAAASAGQLDSSFGTGGKVFTAFHAAAEAKALSLQTDGRVVVAGYMTEQLPDGTDLRNFAVARYNSDGTLDSTFGVGGKVSTNLSCGEAQANALAIQPDGKILAAGEAQRTGDDSSTDFALVRYNPDGSLDASFGSGGEITTDFFGEYDAANALALQPDGQILIAGFAQKDRSFYSADFAVCRFNTDGSLDSSFGIDGKITTDFFGGNDTARAIRIQDDARIVLCGNADRLVPDSPNVLLSVDFALARYNPNGSLDSSFGAGGKVHSNLFGNIEEALALALQSDGGLVAAGGAAKNFAFVSSSVALSRYDPNGVFDTSFITIAKETPDSLKVSGFAKALALQSDGKIVAAGGVKQCGGINCEDFLVARFNADGSVDTSFGVGGQVNTDFFGGFDTANAVAIQPDGKIVAAGSAHSEDFDRAFAIARYLPEPNFSVAFNPGTVTVSRGTKVAVTLTISRIGGFSGEITVTPADTSAQRIGISPNPVKTSGTRAIFKIKAKANAMTGPRQIIFTATDAFGRVRASSLNLVVE